MWQCLNSVLNVKAVVAAFNQEKALVGAFSVIVQPVVEPMDRFAALVKTEVAGGSSIEYAAGIARSSASCRMDINIEAAGVEKLA